VGREETLRWPNGYCDDGGVEGTANVSIDPGWRRMMLTEKWECMDSWSMKAKPVLLLVR